MSQFIHFFWIKWERKRCMIMGKGIIYEWMKEDDLGRADGVIKEITWIMKNDITWMEPYQIVLPQSQLIHQNTYKNTSSFLSLKLLKSPSSFYPFLYYHYTSFLPPLPPPSLPTTPPQMDVPHLEQKLSYELHAHQVQYLFPNLNAESSPKSSSKTQRIKLVTMLRYALISTRVKICMLKYWPLSRPRMWHRSRLCMSRGLRKLIIKSLRQLLMKSSVRKNLCWLRIRTGNTLRL